MNEMLNIYSFRIVTSFHQVILFFLLFLVQVLHQRGEEFIKCRMNALAAFFNRSIMNTQVRQSLRYSFKYK
jgi:hypothetical protein